MKKVIFVGAGEYAESVYDSMAKEEYDLIGFVDEYKKGYHMGKPILAATIEEVFNFRDYAYFISIGDTEPRKRQFEAVKRLRLETINIIDKTALISDSVKIGTGNFIGKMAVINIGSTDDASIFFARELDYIKSKSYDKIYPEFTALNKFPITHEVPEGAESMTYYSYERTGMAAIISNYATDLPRADVKGAPSTAFVKSLGASYGYSVQDMRASRMAGKSLDTRRAEAARYAVDRTTNIIAFAGDKKNNLVGVLSTDNNIPLYTLSEVEVDGQKYTDFKHKTAAQILDDINGMFAYQAKITKGVEHADTLMLPHSVYIDISTRQIPNTGYTVLRFLKENAPYLKDIVSAPELESDAEDTNPYNKGVMFLYTNSADKFSLEIPMPFYQYPLQNRNLEVIVPCEERVAGCIIYYPLSALIAVGA